MKAQESIWRQTADIPQRQALENDIHADVAVIGAGMAGILTAYQLKRRGVRAVVLEANRIGSGQTGGTTAKITSQHGLIYQTLIAQMGEERAAQYARAQENAIQEYARIIDEKKIECAFRRTAAYLYSVAADTAVRREAQAAVKLGLDAHFTTDTELPFSIAGAVRFDGQAQFHPLRFLRALCDELEIYEHTRVLSVEDNRVMAPHGSVQAKYVVFAAHYPFVNVPGWYFLRMHQERSYVLALKNCWRPQGMYLGVDAQGLSFREAEGMLLMGGGKHRTGENSAGGKYEMLRRKARELLPGSHEAAHWSAQDCVTLDGVPYIGVFSPVRPNWYVASGFDKWGMSNAMAAAMQISSRICGERPRDADVFSPERFTPAASAKSFAADTAQAVKGLARGLLSLPETVLEALPRGHGGIVEADGIKAGVYKDNDGKCHIIDPRCPHLGCRLEWNPDELSWDCPCHGSRFHYDGALIDGPAQSCAGNRIEENETRKGTRK